MRNQKEYELQKAVCKWIKLAHPTLLFMTDSIAAVKLTMPQAIRNKQVQKEGFKCPDLIIFEARDGYFGLFIELKTKSPYKKDGSLLKDEHLEAQHNTIHQLGQRGYRAMFAWDLEQVIEIITEYMSKQKTEMMLPEPF